MEEAGSVHETNQQCIRYKHQPALTTPKPVGQKNAGREKDHREWLQPEFVIERVRENQREGVEYQSNRGASENKTLPALEVTPNRRQAE